MKFTQVSFHILLKAPLYTHEFNGSMIRGTFLHQYRELVCTESSPDCEFCSCKENCSYTELFEPSVSAQGSNSPFGGITNLPRPFVFDTEHIPNRRFQVGESFSFSMKIIGKALEYLPVFVMTVAEMGKLGLGSCRATFELLKVTDDLHSGKELFNCTNCKLGDPVVLQVPGRVTELAHKARQLEVHLLTPLRIQQQGRTVIVPSFYQLIRAGQMRLELLMHYFGGEKLPWSAKELLGCAHDVELIDHKAEQVKVNRYSSRQDKHIGMVGTVGELTYAGDFTTFLPLLNALENIHLGKSAAFGLGKIQLRFF